MDSLQAVDSLAPVSSRNLSLAYSKTTFSEDQVVIETALLSISSEDRIDVGVRDLPKALGLNAQKIIDKLNELLKEKYGKKIEELKPEEVTPEATAERIVSGSTAFFAIFAKQNPNLEGEELLEAFMKEVRSGIEQGYSEAYGILEDLGAFNFKGVREGIEQTKVLIEEKLSKFESFMRKQLGLENTSERISAPVKDEFLAEGGGLVKLQQ
ncbi:MAG: hypothetical protein DCC75_03725 [Proteobacteria bacterium]|nr:MAG: hypothetical protein DCC75_03725 [Pseudomonadota bacterium]